MNQSLRSSKTIIAWGAMVLIGVLWGGTIPLSKIAVSTGYQPLGLIFWQLILGVLVLGVILLFRGWRPQMTVEKIKFYCVIAIIGTIIPNGFSYMAAAQLPAGVMSISIATVPMFALVIALGLGLEKASIIRISGVLIGFAAMVMIAAPKTSLPEPEKAVFVLVALLAPFCYGMESNYIAVRTPKNTDAVSTLFMASFLGLFLVGPLAFGSGQWISPFQSFGAPEYALIASSIIHAATYVGYIWLVGYGGPVFSVQVAYVVTLAGVFLSILFLNEGYSSWVWLALVLVIVGLALVQPKLDDLKAEEANA